MKTKQRTTWLDADQICIANSQSVALNLMFETKKDHQLFHTLWKKYLGGMTDVIRYSLCPTGWTVLFKTKNREQIRQSYHSLRLNSQKAKLSLCLTEEKRMISEHFRIFISQFARLMNMNNKRKGTLVLERFNKYVLNEKADYHYIYKIFENIQLRKHQKHQKYLADENQYDQKKELQTDSPWRIGSSENGSFHMGFVGINCMSYAVLQNYVLRKLYSLSKTPIQNLFPP